ncbi:MAG: hypothetical protein IPN76_10405 [Saprospiraceae bacterium]|nr:hypothetical protein [Saprospiraceae bacterium]
MLDILRGMFVFVIWGQKRTATFGARDHLGIKPLLYSLQNNEFVFCSELKGFLASGLYNENKLDIHSINSYLAIGNTIPPYSMVEGINALKSGHYFTFKNGQFNETPYWFPETIEPISSKDISYDECVQK